MEIELFLAQFAGAMWAEGEANVQERHLGRKMRHGRAVGRWFRNRIVEMWTLGSYRAGMSLPLACTVCIMWVQAAGDEAQQKGAVQQYAGVTQMSPRSAHRPARPGCNHMHQVLKSRCRHWPSGAAWWDEELVTYWRPARTAAAGMVILAYGGYIFNFS